VSRADLDKQPFAVAAMFDRVAGRYDLTNDVLAVGQTRKWRRLVVSAVDAKPGQRVLDLAAGTGTSSEAFARVGAEVVPCDFSLGMLEVGRGRLPHLPFVAGDAMALPFADQVFDAVTISFGLRNIHDPVQGLREMRRVTRPGGRLVVCEFSTPTWPVFRTIYEEYLMKALPQIAKRVASNSEAYEYLAESIAAWPDQQGLAAVLMQTGWRDVAWRNLSGGIVALHRGVA
jgi:demethylmenaquinone methyltransferase/2-methoxy-6-polyprenyl-1,4-benzoquinol methylase